MGRTHPASSGALIFVGSISTALRMHPHLNRLGRRPPVGILRSAGYVSPREPDSMSLNGRPYKPTKASGLPPQKSHKSGFRAVPTRFPRTRRHSAAYPGTSAKIEKKTSLEQAKRGSPQSVDTLIWLIVPVRASR